MVYLQADLDCAVEDLENNTRFFYYQPFRLLACYIPGGCRKKRGSGTFAERAESGLKREAKVPIKKSVL